MKLPNGYKVIGRCEGRFLENTQLVARGKLQTDKKGNGVVKFGPGRLEKRRDDRGSDMIAIPRADYVRLMDIVEKLLNEAEKRKKGAA